MNMKSKNTVAILKDIKHSFCIPLENVKIDALSSYQCLIFICQFMAKMSKSLGKAYIGLVLSICQVLEGNNQVFLKNDNIMISAPNSFT